MRSILYVLAIILVLISPAAADSWDDVSAERLRDAAAAYLRGDFATALRLYRPFAEKDYAFGQVALGEMYEKGQGVPQDYAEALRWYRKAAEQGDARAQTRIGLMYGEGRGAPQDYAESVRWYRKAAEQGAAVAQTGLGLMYGVGRGVPRDYVQAHMWCNLSAAQGDKNGAECRDLAATLMTPAQIAEAQKLAKEWVAAHHQ